jgi:hypothetical protein
MKPKDYTIDELIAIFGEQSKDYWDAEKIRSENLDFKHLTPSTFCICDALLSICKAIKNLEEWKEFETMGE